MGWDEPSGGDKDKNPWGNRHGSGPPDLDEVIQKLQQGIGKFFSRKSTTQSNGNGRSFLASKIIVLTILAAWLCYDCFYAIDEQERGVVLRFGEHVANLQPGLSLRFPRPIERVIKINVGQIRSITHKASMLTQDENIVDVHVAVQWKIQNPADYLFNLTAPAATLRQVMESAVREVIGKSPLDFVLTEGRSEVAQRQQVLMQDIVDLYRSGISVVKVEMQFAKPPEEVKAAFDDAIKAREDEQKSVNQAEAYRNDIIPRARGAAARLGEEANSYKARVIAKATGEADRFKQLLTEYKEAPEVTRQRLYLDAIETVLSSSNKVLIDAGEGSNSLMYLPIDKLIEQRRKQNSGVTTPNQFNSDTSSQPNREAVQTSDRTRGNR